MAPTHAPAGAGPERVPAAVNAHSHAFHRVLRGRTQGGFGNFWTWREQMYAAARALEPAGYERLATAVFAEMVVSGFSAVGEFHYVHHDPAGRPYPDHDMERALARAATAAGIRLVLLDTCYLAGGIGRPLSGVQRRFSDGDAAGWLDRLARLRTALADEADTGRVGVGAAIHSVRAVGTEDLAVIADRLDPDLPLHVHLSEQRVENAQCLAAHGLSPAALLHRHGLLRPGVSVVHATHLAEQDVVLLGEAGVSVVMCPSTEADLADGIGPARELADAGAAIALGTDAHGVIDPWLEMRSLEHGERLRTGVRGRFTPGELLGAATSGGRRSLGLPGADDHVLLRTDSVRTAGADPEQLPLVATAADVAEVVVDGRTLARDGVHATLGDPAELYAAWLRDAGADHGRTAS